MPRGAATVVAAALVLAPASAAAWEWTRTGSGAECRWEGSCVHWTVVEAELDNSRFPAPAQPFISFDELRDAVRGAFDAWEAVPCSYIRFVELEPAHCVDVGLHPGTSNANRIVLYTEGWLDPDATWREPLAVAVTSVFYDTRSGEILDVDIEVNADLLELSTTLDDARWDLQNALTHEVGHLIGFDHSEVETATMWFRTFEGDLSLREPDADDIEGLCLHYPVATDPGRCEAPDEGFDLDCDEALYCAEEAGGIRQGCVFDEDVCCCEEAGGLGRCEWRGWPECVEAGRHAIAELDEVSACGGEEPDSFTFCCCEVLPGVGASCEWASYAECRRSGRLLHTQVNALVLCGDRPTADGGCSCTAPTPAAWTAPGRLARAILAL